MRSTPWATSKIVFFRSNEKSLFLCTTAAALSAVYEKGLASAICSEPSEVCVFSPPRARSL